MTPRTWARSAVQDEKALGPWALGPDPPLVKGGESGHGSASQAPGQEGHLEATEASAAICKVGGVAAGPQPKVRPRWLGPTSHPVHCPSFAWPSVAQSLATWRVTHHPVSQ